MKRTLGRAAPALALALMGVAACDKGLTELNVDPNNPPFVAAPAILPEAQSDVVNRALGSNFNLTMLGLWSQSFAKIQYIDEDRYALRSTTIDAHWAGFYGNGLEDFQKIIEQGDSLARPNWTAIGTIMQQWTFQIVTDTWGDVPYSEALLGPSNTRPKYDAQKDIYYGMMAKLAAASAMIQPGGVSFGGEDAVYGGDVVAWRKFSNSLRLRMAMRISNVDPTKAKAEFLAALAPTAAGSCGAAAAVPCIISSNADNAALHYSGAVPSDNPIYAVFHEGQRYDQVIAKATVDSLLRLNDPRLPVYADPAPNGCAGGGVYCGWQNGITRAPAPDFFALSPIGAAFKENPSAPSMMMDYAEVLFLRAEAAAKGWTAEDPADLYRQGIAASMHRFGIGDAAIAAYLAQPGVAYAGLKSIYFQKWIALYGNGPEQFASWRRETVGGVHYPGLTPAAASSGKKIPYRVFYPASEQSTNAENWSAAVAANGGSGLYDKPVWWASVTP
ncbi:MAG TPA: SusD/RagB family nutrient-binding outer membrane lipoprotein [Longimicrobiaceae bacterium]|nr:SusD/RagB family nutrient-binding outer membrane lipoprotein [Longimicrobiaceae bacterium]